jgi:uncharacterized protein (DUF58 family)
MAAPPSPADAPRGANPQSPWAGIVDPRALALVARLEMVARTAVEGLLSGIHPSPFFGSSVEYADHRPYTPSDELRSLDWKLVAKTDRYFVKLFEDRTNTRVTVVLDTSRSMGFGSTGTTKLDFGRGLTAALLHLALKQNDAAGLVTFDDAVRSYVPPRSMANHFRHLLAALASATPGGDTGVRGVLAEVAGRLPRRGIVVLVSDMLDDPAGIASGLSLLRHRRHDLVVFHVVDPAERSFPWERSARFRDMEGEGRLVANPRLVRAAYQERFEAFLNTVRAACLERSIGYELVVTDQPYEDLLAAYLSRRARLSG